MPQSNSKNTIAERIPTELLCKIFHGTFPHSRDAAFGDTIVTVPWKLGFVCQRWRDSALGDPSLWSSIEIQCRWRSAAQLAPYYPLAALQTQILRSGDIPLEITFGCGSHDDGEVPSSHFLALLETVVRESQRWRKLNLNWALNHPTALLILAQIKGRLPKLHHLRLNWGLLAPTAIFEVAPQLRKLESSSFLELKPLSVPWPQITHFRGRSPARVCLYICSRATGLVECAFTSPARHAPPPETPAALLPQLRRLAVTGAGILPFIETPNLEYLFLDSLTFAIPFLLRSQCRLKGLKAISCPSPDLIRLVPHIPTLLHLNASFTKVSEPSHPTDQLFRVFVDACPQLVSIHVTFGQLPCPYDALYDLFVARRRTLKFACLHERARIIPTAVKQRFAALRSDFLEIILEDCESRGIAWMRQATEDMQPPVS
ncbi:hypothetical protein C8R46DRAFT_1208246 [Mycena filopes]|nr:hypothetical protein C8R46DRAFT_1208246 [Mycena filopes]